MNHKPLQPIEQVKDRDGKVLYQFRFSPVSISRQWEGAPEIVDGDLSGCCAECDQFYYEDNCE